MTISTSSNLNTADMLLDAVYQSLDYTNGTLLKATNAPEPGSAELSHWVEKGEWLSLAHQIGGSDVFFVNNDPVIVFYKFTNLPSNQEIVEVLRLAWNMARPHRIFIALDGELNIYSLTQSPSPTLDDWQILASVQSANDVLSTLAHYHRANIESYAFLEVEEQRFGAENQRADRQLIQDITTVRKELLALDISPNVAHALIGRSIFIRYLEDRGVLTTIDFNEVAASNPAWLTILQMPPEKPVYYPHRTTPILYERVLRNREFTFALFDKLQQDFNGDMFPITLDERALIKDNVPFELMRKFLFGDMDKQSRLFFWAYAFDIIPIELISSIYEEFYHYDKTNTDNLEDDKGTHYTPRSLVSFVLSQVLTEAVLDTHPRILDPACGSGIFLVEAYRRIVRHWCKCNPTQKLSPAILRNILQEQICGIELNREAAHIAAFSLYLALLHYQDPPSIRKHRLPTLIYNPTVANLESYSKVIFNADTFGLTTEEREALRSKTKQNITEQRILKTDMRLDLSLQSFDVIVGNPPWEQLGEKTPTFDCADLPSPNNLKALPKSIIYNSQKHTLSFKNPILEKHLEEAKTLFPTEYEERLETLKLESDKYFQAERWATVFDKKIGDKNLSQYFIQRSLTLVKTEGMVALLVHASTLFNYRSTSQKFRKQWLAQSQLWHVFNFIGVRNVFFERAIAPFVLVHFSPRKTDEVANPFVYSSATDKALINLSKAVILTNYNRKVVDQEAVMANDYLWKTYWWGNHQDERLLRHLGINATLKSLAQQTEEGKVLAGYGFQNGPKKPQGIVATTKPLKSEKMIWYGTIQKHWFENIPTGTGRDPSHRLYQGQRLIVGRLQRGGPVIRLEYDTFPFRHLIYSMPLDHLSEWQAKMIIGIFWSRIGKYRMFLTALNWATWHDKMVADNILNMPIPLPPNENEFTAKIVKAVDKIRAWEPPIMGDSDSDQAAKVGGVPSQLHSTMQTLNEAVYSLFNLRSIDRDLIDDFYEYTFNKHVYGADYKADNSVQSQLNKNEGVIADLPPIVERKKEQELEAYLATFLKIWNIQLASINGELRWLVVRSNEGGNSTLYPSFLAVIFTTQFKDNARISNIDEQFSEIYKAEWETVLNQLSGKLRQPINRKIYVDGMVRAVSDTSIVIIKRDQGQYWTRSRAREDAEATILQVMNLQETLRA